VSKPICSREDCDAEVHCRGLCNRHYRRWLGRGTTDDRRQTPEQRFWAKVAKTEGCWLWTGAITKRTGYGAFGMQLGNVNRWHNVLPHRFAYELLVGPVPEGLELDHLCFVRRCVRPEHLEPVTAAENHRRALARKTHCPKGHPYDTSTDKRECITCKRQSRLASYHRSKGTRP
jgi:hypothetical protein